MRENARGTAGAVSRAVFQLVQHGREIRLFVQRRGPRVQVTESTAGTRRSSRRHSSTTSSTSPICLARPIVSGLVDVAHARLVNAAITFERRPRARKASARKRTLRARMEHDAPRAHHFAAVADCTK